MFGKKAKIFIFSTIFLMSSHFCSAQFINGFRFGGGLGLSTYWGTQMDYTISLNTYKKSELNPGFHGQLHYAINDKHEIGVRALVTELWSFKSDNYLGLNAKINDFFVVYQRSLNNNISLKSYNKFTFNAVAGLGVIYFKSTFYIANPKTGIMTPFSSVGEGAKYVSSGLQIPEQRPTIAGMLGFNIGYRLNKNFTIYLENSITLSGSNKITGNLLTKYEIPNNGYSFHSLGLYFNFNSKLNPLGCPKF